MIETEEDI